MTGTDPKLVAEINSIEDAIADEIIDAVVEEELPPAPAVDALAGDTLVDDPLQPVADPVVTPTGGPYKPTGDPVVTPMGGPYKPTGDPVETNGGPYKPTTDEPAAATTAQ